MRGCGGVEFWPDLLHVVAFFPELDAVVVQLLQ